MPLSMVGRLCDCMLLAYRTPAASVRDLLPPGLELLTRGEWGFWSVVACRIEGMRPRGVPEALGVTYRHVAYRLYVRATTTGGEPIDGIYFVRSDADSGPIAAAGNAFSDFHFHPARIDLRADGRELRLAVRTGGDDAGRAHLRALIGMPSEPPRGSPFHDRNEAAAFLKYRPLGLAVANTPRGRRLRLAEVFRDEGDWQETPLQVAEAHWEFFHRLGQDAIELEHAVLVAPIQYRWRLGRSVPIRD